MFVPKGEYVSGLTVVYLFLAISDCLCVRPQRRLVNRKVSCEREVFVSAARGADSG